MNSKITKVIIFVAIIGVIASVLVPTLIRVLSSKGHFDVGNLQQVTAEIQRIEVWVRGSGAVTPIAEFLTDEEIEGFTKALDGSTKIRLNHPQYLMRLNVLIYFSDKDRVKIRAGLGASAQDGVVYYLRGDTWISSKLKDILASKGVVAE